MKALDKRAADLAYCRGAGGADAWWTPRPLNRHDAGNAWRAVCSMLRSRTGRERFCAVYGVADAHKATRAQLGRWWRKGFRERWRARWDGFAAGASGG